MDEQELKEVLVFFEDYIQNIMLKSLLSIDHTYF